MPSDLELAVKTSKRLERLLTERHGAEGRGLHEKVDSVRGALDDKLVRNLRLIATVRNKLVHEDGYDRIEGRDAFRNARRLALRALEPRSFPLKAVAAAIAVLIVGAAIAWLLLR